VLRSIFHRSTLDPLFFLTAAFLLGTLIVLSCIRFPNRGIVEGMVLAILVTMFLSDRLVSRFAFSSHPLADAVRIAFFRIYNAKHEV